MISSLGSGSGLDLAGLVDNLLAIERQQAERPLNRRQLRAEVRVSALGSLSASLASLADTVSALESLGVGRSVVSSLDTAVTATASDTADPASYLVNVQQIAIAQSLATSNASPFADPDASLGEGTLTVSIGSDSVDIELSAGQDSLRDVRDAINASDLDVQAAVVQNGSDFFLLLTSGQTGTGGTMTLTVDGTVDTRLASANMDETATAQDALYSVNGLSLSSTSNSIADVLPGLNLELLADTGGQPVKLDVVADKQGLEQRLGDLLSAYNAIMVNMSALGGASADGSEAGPLVGDASLRALQRVVSSALYTNRETGIDGNPFANLIQIGVHTDESGTASLDTAELDAALAVDEPAVEALISEFASSFGEALEAYRGSDGILTVRTDQLNAELKRIGEQRQDVERRLIVIEERLRARFGALDALVAQFQNTSTFLEQQLASIRAISEFSKDRN